MELELVTDVDVEFEYNSRRFPAPQYSYALPGQRKLQSVRAATVLDGSTVLPHQPFQGY